MAEPSGDYTSLKVHRVRFVDWSPSVVTALAFPPRAPPRSQRGIGGDVAEYHPRLGTLAVGRSNGNIELCEWTGQATEEQAPQAWVVRKVLAAPSSSKVESLAFALRCSLNLGPAALPRSDLRLFSNGGGSDVIEWDLQRGLPMRTTSSQAGSIWCMAINPTSTMLAIGCDDGSIRLISLSDDNLEHVRRLDRCKSRILSVAWGPPTIKTNVRHGGTEGSADFSWDDSWIVAGCSDSSLRRWDLHSGRVLDRMQTDKVRGEQTLIWAVAVLSDSTIVSGDSQGTIKFWEPKTATQFASIRAHQADVLCLIVGPYGKSVYSTGIDQKVAELSLTQTTSGRSHSEGLDLCSKWILSCTKHLHWHDIRSLAIWPPYSPFPRPVAFTPDAFRISPILASGGRDMTVVLTPCMPATGAIAAQMKTINPLATSVSSVFEEAYQRRMAHPSSGVLQLAKGARMLLCRKDKGISLWTIAAVGSEEEMAGGWELLLEMSFQVKTNLTAAAVSDDGRWLSVSDMTETRLFWLEKDPSGKRLKPRRIKKMSSIVANILGDSACSTGSSHLTFTPDSTKLILGLHQKCQVVVVDISSAQGTKGTIAILRVFDQHSSFPAVSGDCRVVKAFPAENLDGTQSSSEAGEMSGNRLDESDRGAGTGYQEDISTVLACMAVSDDGQWLATADLRGRVNIFNLDNDCHHATLPSFPEPIRTMTFDPSPHASTILVLGQARRNKIQVFHVEDKMFLDWPGTIVGAAGEVITPDEYATLHDPLAGLFFLSQVKPCSNDITEASARKREVVAWGSNWMCKIELDGPIEDHTKNRRKRDARGTPISAGPQQAFRGGNNFRMCHRYRHILAVVSFGDGELLVVERPLVDLLRDQPPPFYKHKFGT